jgi:hypothetical protein
MKTYKIIPITNVCQTNEGGGVYTSYDEWLIQADRVEYGNKYESPHIVEFYRDDALVAIVPCDKCLIVLQEG